MASVKNIYSKSSYNWCKIDILRLLRPPTAIFSHSHLNCNVQNAFWQWGSDSRWFLSKKIEEKKPNGTRDPDFVFGWPPLNVKILHLCLYVLCLRSNGYRSSNTSCSYACTMYNNVEAKKDCLCSQFFSTGWSQITDKQIQKKCSFWVCPCHDSLTGFLWVLWRQLAL